MRKPKNEHWLIIIALVITTVYACQTFSGNIVLPPQSTLFPTLVQSLCTIFALVFTISLVAAQIGSKYSQKTMDIIFNKYTILYMFSYLIAIFFCMCGLLDRFSNLNTARIGSILAVMNLSLLIPFIYVVKEKLKTRNLLEMLSRNIIEAKRENKPVEEYMEYVYAIDNIIYSSYKDLDFIAFREGIKELLSIYINVPDPGDLGETIMRTLMYVDSLDFQEERSTDIIMDELCDTALLCLDNGEKVENIVIELRNLLEQVGDVQLKIRYLLKSWTRTKRIFENCIESHIMPEMMYRVYFAILSMSGLYLLILYRIVRDVPGFSNEKPRELAALPDFVSLEIMKVVKPGFESTLNDLISLIGKWAKEAEEEKLSELKKYYIDLLAKIREKSENLIFDTKKISEICDEILKEI